MIRSQSITMDSSTTSFKRVMLLMFLLIAPSRGFPIHEDIKTESQGHSHAVHSPFEMEHYSEYLHHLKCPEIKIKHYYKSIKVEEVETGSIYLRHDFHHDHALHKDHVPQQDHPTLQEHTSHHDHPSDHDHSPHPHSPPQKSPIHVHHDRRPIPKAPASPPMIKKNPLPTTGRARPTPPSEATSTEALQTTNPPPETTPEETPQDPSQETTDPSTQSSRTPLDRRSETRMEPRSPSPTAKGDLEEPAELKTASKQAVLPNSDGLSVTVTLSRQRRQGGDFDSGHDVDYWDGDDDVPHTLEAAEAKTTKKVSPLTIPKEPSPPRTTSEQPPTSTISEKSSPPTSKQSSLTTSEQPPTPTIISEKSSPSTSEQSSLSTSEQTSPSTSKQFSPSPTTGTPPSESPSTVSPGRQRRHVHDHFGHGYDHFGHDYDHFGGIDSHVGDESTGSEMMPEMSEEDDGNEKIPKRREEESNGGGRTTDMNEEQNGEEMMEDDTGTSGEQQPERNSEEPAPVKENPTEKESSPTPRPRRQRRNAYAAGDMKAKPLTSHGGDDHEHDDDSGPDHYGMHHPYDSHTHDFPHPYRFDHVHDLDHYLDDDHDYDYHSHDTPKMVHVAEHAADDHHKECTAPLSADWAYYNWYQILLDNGGAPGGYLKSGLIAELAKVEDPCVRPVKPLYTEYKKDFTFKYAKVGKVFRVESVNLRLAGTPHQFLDFEGQLIWAPPNVTNRFYQIIYRKDDTGLYVRLVTDARCEFRETQNRHMDTYDVQLGCELHPGKVCDCDEHGHEVCHQVPLDEDDTYYHHEHYGHDDHEKDHDDHGKHHGHEIHHDDNEKHHDDNEKHHDDHDDYGKHHSHEIHHDDHEKHHDDHHQHHGYDDHEKDHDHELHQDHHDKDYHHDKHHDKTHDSQHHDEHPKSDSYGWGCGLNGGRGWCG